MDVVVFDIETDGFNPTKIHVFSWDDGSGVVQSTSSYERMREVLEGANAICGHNVTQFDLPVLERLTGAVPKGMIVDTLPLSWYLNHKYMRHGLADYGERYGVPKPKVEDWVGLTYEEYKHRCEEDVKINSRLWKELRSKLNRLYKGDYTNLVNYLTFKMECLRDQEAYGWKLDVTKAQHLHDKLLEEKQHKEDALSRAMPEKIMTMIRNPPKNMHKKDGSLSAHGERWKQTLADNFMPTTTMAPITVVVGSEAGNPSSHVQIKDWLWSLGWKPRTFDYKKGENYGEERKIPQVRDGDDLCESVRDLMEVEPAIGLLDGLTVVNHRLSVVKGFLESHVDGWLYAGAHGLTNTFRFKHKKPLVNLPGVDKPYGEDIRGCLIAPDGEKLIGCDMVSLEDTTKRHYIQPLDPEYVAEMSHEGFDSHLDLARHAGEVTQDQIDQHNSGVINLKAVRKNYKAANYACVYGVGEVTLGRQTGLPKGKAKKLIEAYWERNWAVKKVADSRKVREINGEKWILNEVSGFWHSLRAEKDRWSTTNQSTGVYCFDTFVALVRAKGLRVIGQFHDEVAVQSDSPEDVILVLNECCEKLNAKLKLNVPLGIDYSVGDNYAEVH